MRTPWALHALGSFAAVGAAALVGGLGGGRDPSARAAWYARDKPSVTPPPWVFGAVWPVLYLCVAAALFLGLRAGLPAPALAAFAANLALNAAWSPLFFGLGAVTAALFVCGAAAATAAYLVVAYLALGLRAGALLLAPYALWLLFATALNAGFVVNRRRRA